MPRTASRPQTGGLPQAQRHTAQTALQSPMADLKFVPDAVAAPGTRETTLCAIVPLETRDGIRCAALRFAFTPKALEEMAKRIIPVSPLTGPGPPYVGQKPKEVGNCGLIATGASLRDLSLQKAAPACAVSLTVCISEFSTLPHLVLCDQTASKDGRLG